MNDVASSVLKASPPIGVNFWMWLVSHDINWWVALATIAYIVLQAFYLIRNKGRKGE